MLALTAGALYAVQRLERIDDGMSDLARQVSRLEATDADLAEEVAAGEARLADAEEDLDEAQAELGLVGSRVGNVESSVAEQSDRAMDVGAVSEEGLLSLVTVHCAGGQGSGFAYDVGGTPEGYTTAIITNHHVIEECVAGDQQAQVEQDGVSPRTLLSSWDEDNDVALLWIDLALPELHDAAEPAVGDAVVALGSPWGLDNTVTQGIVSNIYPEAIQTDASVDRGNSGGPLLDRHGKLLGIVSMGIGGQNTNIAWRPTVLCERVLTCR